MKINLRWFVEYVDCADFLSKPNELAEILTRGGFEVTEILDRAKNYPNMFIGEILSISKHSESDQYFICQIKTTDESSSHQVVTNQSSLQLGDKIVITLIDKKTILGIDSFGVIGTQKDLTKDSESDTALIVPKSTLTGKTYADYIDHDDVVLDIKIPENRPDCLSHSGFGRAVATLLNRDAIPVRPVDPRYIPVKANFDITTTISTKHCTRYMGKIIHNVKMGDDTDWLIKKLNTLNIPSINNIDDIATFVFLEIGQPMAIYDADKISGKSINVRTAHAGEFFKSRDGETIALKGGEVLVVDAEKIISLAGIIVSESACVSDSTTNIFMEAAHFSPEIIKETALNFGLKTASAIQFGLGVDPLETPHALDRATQVALILAGGVADTIIHDTQFA